MYKQYSILKKPLYKYPIKILKKKIRGHMIKVIIGVLILIFVLIQLEKFNSWIFQFGPVEIQSIFGYLGFFSIPVFISIYVLANAFLIPSVPFVFASGILYGLLGGIIVTLIGEIISGTINFIIGRKIGSKLFVKKTKQAKIEFVKKYVNKHGFKVVFFLRYLGFYFDIVSYASGMTKIKYKNYIIATSLGFIPYIVTYVYAGRQLFDIKSSAFIYTILIFKIVLFTTVILGYYLYKKFTNYKLAKNEIDVK
jgi:uncharacterized membrane protein YdjX (TVP38/TMEM64 family)